MTNKSFVDIDVDDPRLICNLPTSQNYNMVWWMLETAMIDDIPRLEDMFDHYRNKVDDRGYINGVSYLISALIELGVLIDNFEYRHTTNDQEFLEYDSYENHRPFYEYIKSKPMYQLHMI